MTPTTQTRTPSDWASSLIDALESQREFIEALAPLARQQGALIEEGRTDALLNLLAERQKIIDRFVGSQEELARLTENLAARLRDVPEAPRDRIRHLLGAIDEQLSFVMRIDEQDRGRLESVRDETRQQLASLDVARDARTAYLRPGAAGNRFADRHG